MPGASAPWAEYLVGYAVEDAEGMYELRDGELRWRNPEDGENVHLEVAVCDAADGRFIPALDVTATLISPAGHTVGPHALPLLWHPMLYHYGVDLAVPEDGDYVLRVHVGPPAIHAPRRGQRPTLRLAGRRGVHRGTGPTRRGTGRSPGPWSLTWLAGSPVAKPGAVGRP